MPDQSIRHKSHRPPMPGAAECPAPVSPRKLLLAAGAGHFVEWFDLGIYGTLSTIIASKFFADGDPASALLSTFAIFAAGFAVRPLGALFFGPLADRIGRKRVLAIIVLVTSLSTFAMGILPTHAAVGAAAPLMLVIARLVQGFAAGGETSSAVTLLFEYAPANRRAYFTSYSAAIGFVAFVVGSGLALVLTAGLGEDAMSAWGWRLPFLLALPLGIAGLLLRLRMQDTPDFLAMQEAGEISESPTRETFRTARVAMLVLSGIMVIKGVGHWMLQSFMVSYLQTTMNFSKVQSFLAATICLSVVAVAVPLFGLLSDRVGRKPLLVGGTAGTLIVAWPALQLMSFDNMPLAVLGMVLLGLPLAAYDGAINATMAELFPPRIRSGAIAIPYNVSVTLFGGTSPYVATWLIGATGYDFSPAYYLMFAAAVTLITVLRWVKETTGPRAEAAVAA
ncbi:MFS transporter [Streptomyces sp. NBC_01012]|uniref:MFS transporter n=1 Tax=Streptomyces sp. NBC_01012 TaxID=2903717 RepID=UPI00386FCB1B|nr:MFS transporter [Streptomyces sp. NBC_01012]